MHKFEEQLPEAIDLLGRAIRAGHPLSSGLDMVARETAKPVAEEFQRTFEEQRFGLPLEDSLLAMADRVTLVDVRILVTAILIQRNVGGNLAEILDNIAYTIRERFKIRRQLRVYTAQGRMAGYVLAVLPITVGTIIFFLNPDYMMTLFRDPIGKLAVYSAAILQTSGYLWIRKIVNIEI
jgi:tight adherence protein B